MIKKIFKHAIISTLIISFPSILQAENDLKFKGDLRLRTQYETQGEDSRLRERIRFRLGASKELSEQTTVKFGFATGSDDLRSTNQTFDNTFETPDIRFDYAYIDQKLSNQLSLRAGKMKNPIWKPSDLLWDSDINPNGVSFQYKKAHYNITSALLILEENVNSTNKDPIMAVIQPQIKWNLTPAIQIKNAIGLYLTQHVKGVSLNHTAETNTGATTALPNEFAPIVLSAQADLTDQLGLELLRPFGELVINNNADSNNRGGLIGLTVGNKKVKQFGSWQSKIIYRYIEADAWLDMLPDSDAYGGATNTKGLELILKYGLSKNISVVLDYYMMDVIDGTSNSQSLAQLDFNVKF